MTTSQRPPKAFTRWRQRIRALRKGSVERRGAIEKAILEILRDRIRKELIRHAIEDGIPSIKIPKLPPGTARRVREAVRRELEALKGGKKGRSRPSRRS